MNKSKKIVNSEIVDINYDIIEKYFELGYTDGLPVVPPTKEKIDLLKVTILFFLKPTKYR